ELDDPIVNKTVKDHPDLFKITTPIKVDVLHELLKGHPNTPFVESILIGLTDGFWPWANTHKFGYPTMHDTRRPGTTSEDPEHCSFLEWQANTEEEKGQFSHPFGSDLLPG
ncbi:hypothetical protein CPB84DRAFT_1662261, partial [Gymnopilus junonius]